MVRAGQPRSLGGFSDTAKRKHREAGAQLPRLSDCLKRREIPQTFELLCSLLAF